MSDIVFGVDSEMDKFCPICGLPIYKGDNGCRRYHPFKNKKRGRFSGKSNSPNKYNDYR
jgi:hypothetical protein